MTVDTCISENTFLELFYKHNQNEYQCTIYIKKLEIVFDILYLVNIYRNKSVDTDESSPEGFVP